MRKIILAILFVILTATPSLATTVTMVIEGVPNDKGRVRISVCKKHEFLGNHCAIHKSVRSKTGTMTFHMTVPTGTYAIQAFHDENNNGVVDRNWLGIPEENVGFSREDAPLTSSPNFEDVAVSIGVEPTSLTIKLFGY
jgi:uncharacterized protein (DUF2141 family)